MKRGDQAREAVKNKIIEAFGDSYVCIKDKKIYVQAKDGENGETIQFAITLTMPKTPIAGTQTNSNATPSSSTPVTNAPTELSEADKEKVQELMRKLHITPTN